MGFDCMRYDTDGFDGKEEEIWGFGLAVLCELVYLWKEESNDGRGKAEEKNRDIERLKNNIRIISSAILYFRRFHFVSSPLLSLHHNSSELDCLVASYRICQRLFKSLPPSQTFNSHRLNSSYQR